MPGNIGTGGDPLSLLRTEQLRLEVRQSDPSSLETNEIWLRDDLDGKSDKLGELRWNDEGSVKSVPVLAVGSSGSGVREFRRVQLSGQTGFVPLASPSDASYTAFRVQVGGTALAHHDSGALTGPKIVFQNTSSQPREIKIHDPNSGTTTGTGEFADEFAVGDTDGDGLDDIAFIDSSNDALKILDATSGSVVDTGEVAASLTTADTDGDGTDEIAFRDNNLKIHDPDTGTTTDTGKETFSPITDAETDGDGEDEIAFRTPTLKIHDPGSSTTTDTGSRVFSILGADTDGDGQDEIVFQDDSNNELKIFDPSDNVTTFTGVVADIVTPLGAVDTDTDGQDEIAFIDDSTPAVKIHDPGSGTTTDTGVDAFGFAVGDTDGDDEDEIVFRDSSNNALKVHDLSSGTTTDTGEKATAVAVGFL